MPLLIDTKERALRIKDLAFEKKAFDLKIFHVEPLVGYTDYFLVCSGRSDRQVQAIANHISLTLKKEDDVHCRGTEGESHGQWILMDFGDVVVHIFNVPMREVYDLDSLWSDADQVPVEAPAWEAEMRYSLYDY